jgi:hypothetical protein
MTLLRLASVLAFSTAAIAQQAPLEVSDLLAPSMPSAHGASADVVQRGLPSRLEFEESPRSLRHRVSGEGQLAPWLAGIGSDFDRPTAVPPLADGLLHDLLAAVRGGAEGGFRLRQVGARWFAETALAEQVGAALAQVRAAMPAPVRVRLTLERIGEDGAELLLDGSETFHHSETRVLSEVRRRRVLYDFDVEIAQSSATANPIIGELTEGASVMLRARPLPLGEEVVVEAVVRCGAPAGAEPLQPAGWLGPFDRIATRIDEAGLSFRLRRGEPSRHEWTTADGGRLRLTCSADWTAPKAEAGRGPVVLVSPLLARPVVGFRSSVLGEPEDYGEWTPLLEVVEAMREAGGGDAVELLGAGDGAGHGVVLFGGARGPALAQAFAGRVEALLRGARIRVEIVDLPAGAAVAADGELPAGARRLGHFEGPLLLELPTCFAASVERSYLRDWEVEVAQSARIPDPQIGIAEEGLFATFRAVAGPGGRARRVELCLEVERLRELRSLSTSISTKSIALTDASESLVMPQEVLDLELPVVDEFDLAGPVELDEGGLGMLRRGAVQLLGPGRELLVRIRVD